MAGDGVSQSKLSSSCCNWKMLLQIGFFLIWTAIGVAFIVVGAINLNTCPLQPFIPIYMIVAGAFSFAYWIVLLLRCFCPTLGKIFALIVGLFVFAWFIAGSVWVFGNYRPTAGCNIPMYLFVFSILIIQWIFIGFAAIGAVLSCLCCKNSCFGELLQCFSCCPCSEDSQCCSICQCLEGCSCLKCFKCFQCSSCLNCSLCAKCCSCLECCAPQEQC
ncbi:uncharacterized protein LOC120917514 [Rana temporaria]|uniref:uncharacterized protein LOC120917514 n=1 Tax=Rana temporaria TaxID=8407 RepID=UPI001AACC881|nr:uncharacterized protein LOC120917514 [Rana temporaria]XP_040184794.1 uncharacterized protein LOC120917514 [Rana temporaria]XP_040184795.1 uncharacterized protein LOC120917514 [Rana temporaria]